MVILLGFRIKQALDRFWEGTGLLHQMRGEWFDSVSCCVTFSRKASMIEEKKEDVMKFRHTLVRLMSLCHGSALEEIKDEQSENIETIDVLGLDMGTLSLLNECKDRYNFNRVELLLHLTQTLITTAHEDGLLQIAPPILSRVYQTLSRGFVNLLNAKKISDTQFPFPFVQLIMFMLILSTVLTPIMITSVITGKVCALGLTFVTMFGMFSLNFISGELENPFGSDANDLPLTRFQQEMNNCLLMMLHNKADHCATTSWRCCMDLEALTRTKAIRFSSVRSLSNSHDGEDDGHEGRGMRFSNLSARTSEGILRNSKDPRDLKDLEAIQQATGSDSVASVASDNNISAIARARRAAEASPARFSVDSMMKPQDSSCIPEDLAELGEGVRPVRGQQVRFREPGAVIRPSLPGLNDRNPGLSPSPSPSPSTSSPRGDGGSSGGNGLAASNSAASPPLIRSMEAISRSLDEWSRMVEEQVGQLSRTTATLQHFTERVSRLVDSTLEQREGEQRSAMASTYV